MYQLFTTPFFLDMDFATLACVLFFYSFLGWLYESTIFSILEQGKFMNRGCFIGPYLPIYSVVGLLNVYLLSDITSSFKIAFISGLTVSAVEYVTSWGLEKVFHARYWDYSYYPLNINGRISVISGVFFGIAVLFLIKVFHPFTMIVLGKIPTKAKFIFCVFILSVFIIDAILTTIGMCNLNRKCKEIYDSIDGKVENGFDKINDKAAYLKKFAIVRKSKDIVVYVKGINKKFVKLETRIIEAFPDFHSVRYGAITDKLKDVIYRKKKSDSNDELLETTMIMESNESDCETLEADSDKEQTAG